MAGKKNLTTKTIYNKNRSIPVRINLERKNSVLIHAQKECIHCGSILSLVQILFSIFFKLIIILYHTQEQQKDKI